MIHQITEVKFNHLVEHYVFHLDNNDIVLLSQKQLKDNHTAYRSIGGKIYIPIFKDFELDDRHEEITAFELME
ncbi:hypothetical protein PU629_07410 [Pullulanibacillus sp. KACC 23026]|uniref:hypothetical protein n=1 Tax=Pullulanibacillus sp. KACC 23026 TaxID=3028315 RepID=UPI0023AF844E|nr:hypothetical protein [Pullulanibacillus sp. KACC 23026]WEG14185.1 hypothetical protein PU629_07410 [Pullulanibacillus sp. KACC 23026]